MYQPIPAYVSVHISTASFPAIEPLQYWVSENENEALSNLHIVGFIGVYKLILNNMAMFVAYAYEEPLHG